MDKGRFDALARTVARVATRRSLLSRLLGLSLIPLPAGHVAGDETVRARRQRRDRSHQRQRKRASSEQHQRRSSHSEACIPTGQRCPSKKPRGKKGKKLSCRHCCQHLVVNDAAGKKVCGCLPNGSSCTTDSAFTCCSGSCVDGGCSGPVPCSGVVCADGQRCVNDVCVCDAVSCAAGCCDSSGTCHVGENAACGTAGGTCTNCLASNSLCEAGTCLPCDVCQPTGACDFDSVQVAIDSTTPRLTTIRVCPGIYTENDGSPTAVLILRGLTLIGAGAGSDPASSTILQPQQDDQLVVTVSPPIGPTEEVTLRAIRISGANRGGGGVLAVLSRVTLDSCTVTDNHPESGVGGGIQVTVSSRLNLINTLVTNNSAGLGGGIAASSGGQITLDRASRVTNNVATGGAGSGGGIYLAGGGGASAFLPSVDNVTNNNPDNCRGVGTFSYTGDGAVCTTT